MGDGAAVRRSHHLVATALVRPSVLAALELRLMTDDLWVWPVGSAPVVLDGPRTEFQLRRRLVEGRGWPEAADWTPVWIGFGAAWHEFGPDGAVTPAGPLPWAAHQRVWAALEEFAADVRFRRRLGGIPTEPTTNWTLMFS